MAGATFATNNVVTKLAYQTELNVPSFLVLRTGFAAMIIWAVTLAVDRSPRVHRRTYLLLLSIGAVAYAGQSVIFNEALARMPAGAAVMGLYTYPVVVAVLAVTLGRERLRPLRLLALLLGLSGVFLALGVHARGVTLTAGILAVTSGLTWGVTIMIIQRSTTLVSATRYSAIVLTGMTASLGAIGLLTGSVTIPVSAPAWEWLAVSALAMAGGVTAWAGSIARIGPTRASIGNTVEPPATGLIAGVALGEQWTPQLFVGTVLVTCAVALLPVDRAVSQKSGMRG